MLREAFSSWEVMSSREMLEAVGRALTLPPRTVLAGDARVLLLVLPVGRSKLTQLRRKKKLTVDRLLLNYVIH